MRSRTAEQCYVAPFLGCFYKNNCKEITVYLFPIYAIFKADRYAADFSLGVVCCRDMKQTLPKSSVGLKNLVRSVQL